MISIDYNVASHTLGIKIRLQMKLKSPNKTEYQN